jgi:hypothetical protein
MAGRPKNPNKPPTVKAIRVTQRTWDKMYRNRLSEKEPYGNIVERALDELEHLRKKVEGLQVEIEDRDEQIKSNGQYAAKLFMVKQNLTERVEKLEKEREQFVIKKSLR